MSGSSKKAVCTLSRVNVSAPVKGTLPSTQRRTRHHYRSRDAIKHLVQGLPGAEYDADLADALANSTDRAEGLNQDVPPYGTHPAWLSPKNLDERAQGDGSDAAQSRRDACLQDMDVDSVRYPPLQRR